MALANDMTLLLSKISRRLGLGLLEKHLPPELSRTEWAKIIQEDSLVTFSRYFPHHFKLKIDSTTCDKRIGLGEENSIEHGDSKNRTVWYYIKDEITQNVKILGLLDIDWLNYTSDNLGIAGAIGTNIYLPQPPCMEATFNNIVGLQSNADFASLYNSTLYLEWEFPNRFRIVGYQGTNYDLSDFVITLLVEHTNISTISPTKMNIFEDLCVADVANYLYANLKYVDGLETAFVNLDLKLSDLQDQANRRQDIISTLSESYVSAGNDNAPYIWAV